MNQVTLATILTKKCVTLLADTTIEHAINMMNQHELSALIIVDANNHPVGIFTEWDSLKVIAGEVRTDALLGDVMTRTVFTANIDDEIHDAYTLMTEKRIRHLVILDNEKKVAGIVTQGDFFRHTGFDELAKVKSVSDVMNKTIVTLADNATITFAVAQMAENRSAYAVVVDQSHPIGLITEHDILRYASSDNRSSNDPVKRIYQTDFPIITEQVLLSDAAIMMERHGVHQLIIINNEGQLIGLLTRHDLLQAIHGSYFEFLIRQIDSKNNALTELKDIYSQLIRDKAEISKSEHKFRTLFDMLPDGMTLIDPETGLINAFNQKAAEQLGYTREEFSRLRVSDFEAVETTEETKNRIAVMLNHEGQQYQFETTHKHKNNTLINVHVTVATIMIEQKSCSWLIFRILPIKYKKMPAYRHSLVY